jgi:hypothetical protein
MLNYGDRKIEVRESMKMEQGMDLMKAVGSWAVGSVSSGRAMNFQNVDLLEELFLHHLCRDAADDEN